MNKILALVLLAAAVDASAQSGARTRPPGTLPLDEVPPPPSVVDEDPSLEQGQRTTTRIEGENTVTEYRSGGKVVMQRVTPKHGRPYLLIDHKGDGTFTKQDNTLDNGNRVPQWVLLEF
jgi:hypothetical protein